MARKIARKSPASVSRNMPTLANQLRQAHQGFGLERLYSGQGVRAEPASDLALYCRGAGSVPVLGDQAGALLRDGTDGTEIAVNVELGLPGPTIRALSLGMATIAAVGRLAKSRTEAGPTYLFRENNQPHKGEANEQTLDRHHNRLCLVACVVE